MKDYKDYFFATYEIPEDLNSDFVHEGESYLGKIATDIYIPGEHFFANFEISTLVELQTIKSIKKLKACSYVWRGHSEYSLNLCNYFVTDKHLFTKIINKESNLYKKSTLEIFDMEAFSIEEFLEKTQSILLTKFREKFNGNFSIANIETTIEPNFADSIMASFSKDFLELNKLLDPNLNEDILEVAFTDTDLDKLNSIVSRARLAKLRGDLNKNLLGKNQSDKVSKV